VGVLLSHEKRESDDYWMGVRDALRMIDSFVKWSGRNPHRAKSLEQFITDGLIASAKRCESCLSRELGVTYLDEQETEIDIEGTSEGDEVPIQFEEPSGSDDLEFDETPLSDAMGYLQVGDSDEESTYIPEPFDSSDSEDDSSPQELVSESTIEDAISEFSEDEIEIGETSGITMDELDHSPESFIEDIDLGVEIRDFSADFHIAESEPLTIESERIEEEIPQYPPPSEDDDSSEVHVEPPPSQASLEDEDSIPSELTDTPPAPPAESGFTWREYEASFEADESEEEPEPEIKSSEESQPRWSPYDEPITDDIDDESDDEELEYLDEDNPPSPPAPESDESEDERRRRARRLFFGT